MPEQRSVARILVNIHLPVDVRTLPQEQQDKVQIALFSLADIMGVQAEDGLWLGGSPDVEGVVIDGKDVENEHVLGIERFETAVSLGTLPTVTQAEVDQWERDDEQVKP